QSPLCRSRPWPWSKQIARARTSRAAAARQGSSLQGCWVLDSDFGDLARRGADPPGRLPPSRALWRVNLQGSKLRRQDSNLDKENQNVTRLGPKALPAKPSGAVGSELAPQLAHEAENLPPADPELVQVVDAWPELPKHIKAAVLALVHAAR